ncbi:MAG: hypothetical protein ACE5D4_08490, partial [Thermodesulfobacteriota bacterium]
MRWFKHFSDSLDDPFIQDLMDKFSHQGYVAFFGLIEIIAKENGSKLTGNLSISPSYLKRKTRISTAKLDKIFSFCHDKKRFVFNKSSTKVEQKFNKSSTKVEQKFNKSSTKVQQKFNKSSTKV